MKKQLNIFKTGILAVFMAVIGFSCSGDRPAANPTDDTSTSRAIVGMDSSAANLNNPRPAPIGDTSKTAEQANRFRGMRPNQDSAARALHELDQQKIQRQQQNQ
ncbi:hypothetical protein [Pontibacter harenae]|uniref:hypothetical protein n=1 Tax=Pontibacter harenae TaxID=2894083 RepID=UPI001E5F6F9E|nr:hypothetical protein [Pontibacter harenae]MCC9168012.1 hypothetical protein [Pontibacter harenae]